MTFKHGRKAMTLIAVTGLSVAVLGSLLGASAASAAKTSANVGYVYDFGEGANDTHFTGSSIFVNAITGSDPGATYTTKDSSKTVALTNVPVSSIDEKGAAALTPFDTVIVYEVCDLGEHPATVAALNTFLENGGKLMIYDADRCAPGVGGLVDYSKFLFPFTTSSPGPRGAEGSYTHVVASTLTTGLTVGPVERDAVGDANIFTSFSGSWCGSITAKNTLGAEGFVEATARTVAGGLVIYEGEDNWFTDGADEHLRLVFDDSLEQNWAPDGLPCSNPASGIALAPSSQSLAAGGSATVTAKVTEINEKPVEGVKVSFEVTEGPDKGKTGSGTTNSSGETPFTYSNTGGAGTDKVKASFVDTEGKTHTSSPVEVIWTEESGPALDGIASAQHYNKATAKLSSKEASDLVVAFVAADSPYTKGQTSTVSGGGLTWSLVTRENNGLGGAEVWVARAAGVLTEAPITASVKTLLPGSPSGQGYDETITVAAFKNAPGLGAVGTFFSKKGAPTGTVTTTKANSWVWAVGDDWLASIPRTVPIGQTLWKQAFDKVGDTYWVQSTEGLTKAAGTPVTISDPAPTKDPFDMVLVEVL